MTRYCNLPYNHFINTFDPNDLTHLKAYQQCRNTGVWPSDFLDKHNYVVTGQVGTVKSYLEDIIVEAWLEQQGI